MNINDYKIHGCRDIHNQVQSLHHFVHRIVGRLPPANHDGALSSGTLGELVSDGVNHKGNALVHQVVEIGGLTCHLHHHANLKSRHKKKDSQRQGHEKKNSQTTFFYSLRVGDPSGGGSGGSHFFGGHVNAPPLGSTNGPVPGVEETLSGRIWVDP